MSLSPRRPHTTEEERVSPKRRLRPNGEAESPHRRKRPLPAWTLEMRWVQARRVKLAELVARHKRALEAETSPSRRAYISLWLDRCREVAATFEREVATATVTSREALTRLCDETEDPRRGRFGEQCTVRGEEDLHIDNAVAHATFLLRAGPPFVGEHLHALATEIFFVKSTKAMLLLQLSRGATFEENAATMGPRPTDAACQKALKAALAQVAKDREEGKVDDRARHKYTARIAVGLLLGCAASTVQRAMTRCGASTPAPRRTKPRAEK